MSALCSYEYSTSVVETTVEGNEAVMSVEVKCSSGVFMKRVLLLVASCATLMALQEPVQPSLYGYIAESFLRSAEVKHDKLKIELGEAVKKDNNEERLNLQVHAIDEARQRLFFAQLLEHLHLHEPLSDVLSIVSIQRLDLLATDGRKKLTLAARILPQTLFGQVMLARLMMTPCSDTKELRARQEAVQLIADNREVARDLNEAFLFLKRGQEQYLSFFNKDSALHENALQQVYPMVPQLQRQLGYEYWQRGYNVFTKTSTVAIASLATAFGGYQLSTGRNALIPVARFFVRRVARRALNAQGNVAAENVDLAVNDMDHALQQGFAQAGLDQASSINRFWGGYAFLGGGALLTIMYLVTRLEHSIFMNLQTRLIAAADILRGLRIIDRVTAEHPTLFHALPRLAHVRKLLDAQTTSEIQPLFKLLETSTFASKPSYFSNTPRILVAYKLMHDYKTLFTPALEAAGELDAVTRAGLLIADSAKTGYCLANLSDSPTPVVELKGFWNPLMDYKRSQINDITIGQNADRNVLITGPNGSGKSTNMKAVALNVLLAQSLGIAAAQSATITPMQKVVAYLDVKENLSQNLSTFMSELYELEDTVHTITTLPAGARCLTVIDEGMRGTVASEGVKRLYHALEQISYVPGSASIVATHFEEPTRLETETKGAWSNYFVEILEPTPGKFVRTYKLVRGIPTWWFGDEGRRSRFVDWLSMERDTSVH